MRTWLLDLKIDLNESVVWWSLTRRGRQMCDGLRTAFSTKKNLGGCPDCPYHHPERKRPNVRKFTRKKMANFDAFVTPVGQAERSSLRVRIFLSEFFF
jgi:hypothetical protein